MFERIAWLEEVSSTQELLKSKPFPINTVLVAKRQTSGRGRMGRLWHSEEGGLYLSFSLPAKAKEEQTIPLVVAFGVCQYLRWEGLRPAIKWVNDVYLEGKKVCGVLAEKTKDRLIVGVGLNVNQKVFPEDVWATSMSLVSGKEYNLVDVLLRLLDFLHGALKTFFQEGFKPFKDPIEDMLLFKDQEVILYTPEPVVGIMKGIKEDGSLLLLTSEGEKSFTVGELTLRPRW
ncbi:MAG: biotin--[acetyl-CoA-carboxylase] ligase [Aquificota bacterium]|nr:MAG: biotin--[acetyl-CoA-carboxylase] ligase [Aquificota bacterium]